MPAAIIWDATAIVAVSPAPCMVSSLVSVTGICMCEMKMLLHCERLSAHGERPVNTASTWSLRIPASASAPRVASSASRSGSLRFSSDA